MVKKRVLWHSDFCCASGFAQVAHNLFDQIYGTGEYEIDVVGINYHGEPYDRERFPVDIYPAMWLQKIQEAGYNDPFGRRRVIELLATGRYDIYFCLQDTFIMAECGDQIRQVKEHLKRQGSKVFKWIFYTPIDGTPKQSWLANSVAIADYPVTYTRFASDQISKAIGRQIPYIYHGVDVKTFFPLPDREKDEFKYEYLGAERMEYFVVTNVNRNQRRKDIPSTIIAFEKFKKLRPDAKAVLYLHMAAKDQGCDLIDVVAGTSLSQSDDVLYPSNFEAQSGLPIEVVNKIYNMSDVVISTTLGEGWGLSSTEAMACNVPILFPDNTSLSEICEGRSRLIKTRGEFCLGKDDMNQFRPLTDTDDMAQAIAEIYDHPKASRQLAESARAWVQTLTWENIGKEWIKVFERASRPDYKPVERKDLEKSAVAI